MKQRSRFLYRYRNKSTRVSEDFGSSLMMATSFPNVLSPTGGDCEPTLPGDAPIIVIPKTADTVMKVRHQNDFHDRKRQETVRAAQLQRDAVLKYLTTEQRRLQVRLAQLKSKTAAVSGYLSDGGTPRTGRRVLRPGQEHFVSQLQQGTTASSERSKMVQNPSPPSTAPTRSFCGTPRDIRQRHSAFGKENVPEAQGAPRSAVSLGTQYRDHYLVSTPPNVRRRIVGGNNLLAPPSPLARTASRSAEEMRTANQTPGSPVLSGRHRTDPSDGHVYHPAPPKSSRLSPADLEDEEKNSPTIFPPIHAHKSGRKLPDTEAWRIHNLAREFLPQGCLTPSPPSGEKWAHRPPSFHVDDSQDAEVAQSTNEGNVLAENSRLRPAPPVCLELRIGSAPSWDRPESGKSSGTSSSGSSSTEMHQDVMVTPPRTRALAYLHPNTCVQMKPSEIVSKIEVATGKTGILAWLGEGAAGMGRAIRETALRKKQEKS